MFTILLYMYLYIHNYIFIQRSYTYCTYTIGELAFRIAEKFPNFPKVLLQVAIFTTKVIAKLSAQALGHIRNEYIKKGGVSGQ